MTIVSLLSVPDLGRVQAAPALTELTVAKGRTEDNHNRQAAAGARGYSGDPAALG